MILTEVPLTPIVSRNDLVFLQLAIARRADHLSRLVISDPATDVALWLQAEEEILSKKQTPHATVSGDSF